MSFVLLGILNSQAAGGAVEVVYRFQTLGGSRTDRGRSVNVDSLYNSYVFGTAFVSGDDGFLVAKYNSEGVIDWQRTLAGADKQDGNSSALDSNQNVYLLGTTGPFSGAKDILLAKYDTSGTLQWQRTLGDGGENVGLAAAVDSSDAIYVAGATDDAGAGNPDFLLVKYNSSGTVQWQRTLGVSGFDEETYALAIDSADNIYISGKSFDSGEGNGDFIIAKYNSSGTIQWQRVLGGASPETPRGLFADSLDNIYLTGYTSSAGEGSSDMFIAKYNSSGTIQWQRVLGGSSLDRFKSVVVDSANSIYAVGFSRSIITEDRIVIVKYNSSGTIQWQRALGGPNFDKGFSITVDAQDNLYVLGEVNELGEAEDDFFLAVLPNDGSLTGTYVLNGSNVVYQASSLTDSSSSLVEAAASLTSASASLTSSTSTFTSAAASFTEHRVDLE